MNIAQEYFFRSTAKYLAMELPNLALIGLVKYLPSTSSLKSLLRSISGVTGTPSMLQHHVPQGPSSSSLTDFRLTTPFLSLFLYVVFINYWWHEKHENFSLHVTTEHFRDFREIRSFLFLYKSFILFFKLRMTRKARKKLACRDEAFSLFSCNS